MDARQILELQIPCQKCGARFVLVYHILGSEWRVCAKCSNILELEGHSRD